MDRDTKQEITVLVAALPVVTGIGLAIVACALARQRGLDS